MIRKLQQRFETWLRQMIRQEVQGACGELVLNLDLLYRQLSQEREQDKRELLQAITPLDAVQPMSWVPDPAAEKLLEKHLKAVSKDAAQRPWHIGGKAIDLTR